MSLTELLARNPVFAGLDQAKREKLSQMAISRRYLAEEFISHRGDAWPYLFFIESGRVTALKESAEGRSLIVLTLNPGEIFWGLDFFLEELVMPVAFVAREDSHIHLWPRERMLPFLLENGEISFKLACLMVGRMQQASDIVEELAFQPVTGRLARLIIQHYGDAVEESVARDLTLDEMAARIGTTREMVCRQLYRFADNGAIRINRTEFMVTDLGQLETIAQRGK